jgi:hypothetical protein
LQISDLVQPKDEFHFIEEQSSFVLETDKPIKLQYTAPGAVKYHFVIWIKRPNNLTTREETLDSIKSEALFSAESTDGSFEFRLESGNFVSLALLLASAQRDSMSIKDRQAAIIAYLKGISAPYKELTGKTPKSIPVPAYVVVIAEHENGYETAGLVHSYLIEPPLKEIQKAMEGTRNP